LSHRATKALQVDIVGHALVHGLDDRSSHILADGIQRVSKCLGEIIGTEPGQPLLQRLPAHVVQADALQRDRRHVGVGCCLSLVDRSADGRFLVGMDLECHGGRGRATRIYPT
jgi:hypothetical protein